MKNNIKDDKYELANKYLKRFQQINEYNFYSGGNILDEADDDPNADPNAAADPNTGGDPNATADPNADPNAAVVPNAGDPNADPNAAADPNADPNAMGGEYDEIDVEGGEEDNVIDVSDLTAAQEEANNDINNLDDKFAQLTQFSEKLTKLLDKITTKTEEQENELQVVKHELEKRLPTPIERLMIRSADSYPYNVQISDYWKERSKKGDKYSVDINNKDEIPKKEEYVLTDEDIDNFSDIDGYESFNKNLRDLVGF